MSLLSIANLRIKKYLCTDSSKRELFTILEIIDESLVNNERDIERLLNKNEDLKIQRKNILKKLKDKYIVNK